MASHPVRGGGTSGARRPRHPLARWVQHPLSLWLAFAAVHGWLAWLCLAGPGKPLGDVFLIYQPWAEQAMRGDVVGIDQPWVYPMVALVPVLLPLLGGHDGYSVAWLIMVTALNAGAFALLTVSAAHEARRRTAAAWWWLLFLLLLGPIALARLDTVSVSFAVVALLLVARRPAFAGTLIAVATWIKVWPAALLAAIVIAGRRRWTVLAAAGVTSAVVLAVALATGAGLNTVSFITQQTNRELQIEAPVSVPWMWAAALRLPHTAVVYNRDINTFEIAGPGASGTAAWMTPLLVIAAVAVALVGWRATRRASATAVLPALALALVTVMIAFNKVGSPQYITWLAPPIILGLVWRGRRFRLAAWLVLVTAALTQLFYPYLYLELLVLDPALVAALTARNLMLFVVLGWAVTDLWRLGSSPRATLGLRPAASLAGRASGSPSPSGWRDHTD